MESLTVKRSASYDFWADYSETIPDSEKGDYYSVFIPSDLRPKDVEISDLIFKDKAEALKMVKKTKKARFKYFNNVAEALMFAAHSEFPPKNKQKTQIGNEKISLFKGPKPQDLVKFRKGIELGDIESVCKLIWENPRYLVSSGDTPSILQEGSRYNALHVAAKAKHGMMAELILSTISDPEFIHLLYNGDFQDEDCERRIHVLLDLYLNTPDKGLNETPLHFASKFGAASVVEVLVSFPHCDKALKNKFGQTADMIICDRCDNKEDIAELRKKIALHLENNYYIPVLRAEDNSIIPTIGEPFSPGKPPVITTDPLSPRLEIHAYAGPLNKEGAEHFRKIWKTPPRTSTPIKNKFDNSLDSLNSLRYTDPSKGLERLGQKLATQFETYWKEYWAFLDCFVDIASPEGLNLLEQHLTSRLPPVPSPPSVNSLHNESSCNGPLSMISDLCHRMENCKIHDQIDEENQNFTPFLCVEMACNYFANRLAKEMCQKYMDNFSVLVNLFETQTKQLEQLTSSYMEDSRFKNVNFSVMHGRLGVLTSSRLCSLLQKDSRQEFISNFKQFLEKCVESYDCFSSDDEGNNAIDVKPTSTKKQMVCLLQQIMNNFTPDAELVPKIEEELGCQENWMTTKECNCVFHSRRARKNFGLGRSNSYKYNSKNIFNSEISRKLFLTTGDEVDDNKSEEEEISDDEYFTPPSSPSQLIDSDEEIFVDVPTIPEVYLQGDNPTKTDYTVFKALELANCRIDFNIYPNSYMWYHNIKLHPETARERWPSPTRRKSKDRDLTSTPQKDVLVVSCHTPPSNSWLRITGANSPRARRQK